MKVQIRDRDAMASVKTLNLRSYLQSGGWERGGNWGERATIHSKEHGGRTWEILVPLRDTVSDYAESMAEAVAVLSAVEERSQLDVFRDVQGAGADVIPLVSLNGIGQAPLSLRQNADLYKDANDLLASAARAAEKPQAAYRGGMSAAVADYLGQVKPMPSYYAGYSLTLHSPVVARLGEQLKLNDDAPFARRVTSQLANALQSANTAISAAAAGDSLAPFQQAVSSGVSANLCDAVAKLAKGGHGIGIGIKWAAVRPPVNPPSNYQFTSQSADILEQAAKHFRRNEPSYDENITATVVKLERQPQEFDGRALLWTLRDERTIRLQVQFEPAAYDTVIQAFQERTPIALEGDIHPSGKGYELRSPRNLRLVADDGD